MVKMSGAEAIVEALKREKVTNIFGIPGGAIMDVYDVLFNSGIRHILARHEQCAAHMAEGYARASGLVGVCMSTSGPGATNLVTGITNAYMDSSPIIAFTGQVFTHSENTSYMIGRDSFQEADIIGISTPITKSNFQIKKTEEIPQIVKNAFYISKTGRPGPVLIDVPKNLQSNIVDIEFSDKIDIKGYKPNYEPHPFQIKKAVELLLKAERPIILAGGGVILSNASSILLKLAKLLTMPVATSIMGKGSIPEDHPLSIGIVGMHGREANKLIPEADVLLAIGLRFSDRTVCVLDQFCPDAEIIHIDIDSAEIGKNIDVDVPIVADARIAIKEIYSLLKNKLNTNTESSWLEKIIEVKNVLNLDGVLAEEGIKPQKIIVEIRKILPQNAIVATEVGQNQMWAAQFYKTVKPRTFITSGGLGTMGFGFPASIGAKVAKPDVPVVDIAGDGSFIMTEQDLACSVNENIPVTVVILNNGVLGMVAQWQRLFYGRRYSETNIKPSPDFVKLAEAYGARGIRIQSMDEFSKAFSKAVKSDLTTVIDVPISSEENVFPIVPPGKGLQGTIWWE
jgi:acetolactate synthase-1/2/3 large subunit